MGCLGFFGSLRCRSRLPMGVLLSGKGAEGRRNAPPGGILAKMIVRTGGVGSPPIRGARAPQAAGFSG